MTMHELTQWGQFFKDKARGERRHGSHLEDDEIDPDDMSKMTPEQVGAMFGVDAIVRH